jgi:hypothetical protein
LALSDQLVDDVAEFELVFCSVGHVNISCVDRDWLDCRVDD